MKNTELERWNGMTFTEKLAEQDEKQCAKLRKFRKGFVDSLIEYRSESDTTKIFSLDAEGWPDTEYLEEVDLLSWEGFSPCELAALETLAKGEVFRSGTRLVVRLA